MADLSLTQRNGSSRSVPPAVGGVAAPTHERLGQISHQLAIAEQICLRQEELAMQLGGTESSELAQSLLASFRRFAACLWSIAALRERNTARLKAFPTRAKKVAPPAGGKHYACEADGTCVARTVGVEGKPVRLCLGPKMWSAIKEIRARQGMTLTALMNDVARSYPGWPLESALGVYTLLYFMAAATEDGHRRAGHGANAAGYAASDNSAPWFFPLLPNPLPDAPLSNGGPAPDR